MIVVKSPLRLGIAGGGTDLPAFCGREQGYVVNATLDLYVTVILKARWDDLIHLKYSRLEMAVGPEDLEHHLVRECLREAGEDWRGIEIVTLGDVPARGTGLGSSSSLIIGLLQALYAWRGVTLRNEDLARLACRIEIDILKRPIGRQDQYAAAYGGVNAMRFADTQVDCLPVAVSEGTIRDLERHLLMFYTGKQRESAPVLASQGQCVEEHLDDYRTLRALAQRAERALLDGDVIEIGRILDEGWRIKQNLGPAITDPEINHIYALACDRGAIGGKLCGAGGGGFIVLFVPPERQSSVREALGLREVPVRFTPYGSRVVYRG